LVLNADGSYTYSVDADSIDADAVDVFTYTIKDGDGDLTTATLTIDVTDVTGTPADTTGQVDEAGLSPLGTSAGDGSNQIVGGSLSLAGGFSNVELQSGSTSLGNWTVYADGTFDYTLNTATTDVDAVPETDQFSYTAKDANGNSVTNTVTITIVDDVPSISSPDASVKNLGGESLSGIIDYESGADGIGAVNLTLDDAPLGLTSGGLEVQYVVEDSDLDGFDELRAFTTDGDVFIISKTNGESDYTLNMLDTLDLTTTFTNDFGNGVTGNGPVGTYDFASTDGTDNFIIRLSSPDDVNNSAGKIGVDNQNMDTGETLTIEFLTADLSGSYDVNGISLSMFQFGAGDSFTYTLYNSADEPVGTGTVDSTNVTGGDSSPFIGSESYDRIEITGVTGQFKFDGISGQTSSTTDAVFELGATVTDGDGDSTATNAGTYTVTIGDTLNTILGSDDDVPMS
jgi:VCBS repeat-containing protein